MKTDRIATLLELKHALLSSDYVNETRRGEYGRGFKDAIGIVCKTIDNKLQEYMNSKEIGK